MAKKLLALLLCGGLTFGMMTGCGNSDNKESKAEKTNESEKASESVNDSEVKDVSDDVPSWQRDTTPITIDWFVAYDWYAKTFDPVNNMADKKLLEETGITINFSSGSVDKLGAMIAAGELPDVITYDALSTIRLEMENDGLLMDLEALEEQYAPDLNIPQSMKDWYRNEDGKWYSAISYYYGPERTSEEYGGYLVTSNYNTVRVDLLEKIGMTMEDMTTLEGIYEAFKALKEQNIQYEGMDIIPLIGVDLEALAAQLGAYLEDEQGDLVDIRTTPEYLQAIKWYNKLYNEGFITEDIFVLDTATRNEYVSSGRTFFATNMHNITGGRNALYSHDNNAIIQICGQVQPLDPEKEHYLASSDTNGWTATMISAESEYADRIITLFSYLSTEEITLDENYGTDCWEIVEGKAVRTAEKNVEYNADYSAYTSKYDMNVDFFVDWNIILKYQEDNPDDIFTADEVTHAKADRSIVYDTKCFTNVTPESNSDIAIKMTDVNSYWRSAYLDMIMAPSEEECEALYQEAWEEMNNLGYEEVWDYLNQRFQENKEKLGIEYAWPAYQ